ncbi:MAG: RluA family pseudouridine synthase [Caldilineaceae bacterium]|nr:RluA family pseudouridine synthase [Caldilineaceae bacterium]
MNETPLKTFTVPADADGERLDRWLVEQLTGRSRSEIQRWIDEGRVRVDDKPGKSGRRVEQGQRITVDVPPTQETELEAEAIPLAVLYEDSDLLVIDKPAGMVVHPAPGHMGGTLVNAVLHHDPQIEGVGGEKRPGIVHRLDKDTSGLIVVAKNDRAHRHLQRQFASRSVHKVYIALLEGQIDPEKGRIAAPIGRHPVERKRQAVLPIDPHTGESKGRAAVTDFHTIGLYSTRLASGQMGNFSLVEAVIQTGRTHQIRVHFAWMKHPVVGDTLYGYRKQRLPIERQFLHAHKLRFRLPSSGEEREFISPLPADLQSILDQMAA